MTAERTVLVTAATGTVGRPLALRLAVDPRLRVRALIRNPERAGDLAAAGVELMPGDLDDVDALARGLSGVDTLALLTPAGPQAATQAARVIAAARQAGVRKIVRLSAIKADREGPTENTRLHAETEAEIHASGMVHVILRPAAFFQNLLWSAATVLGEGRLYGAYGRGRVAFIDARDVSEALAAAVASGDFDGRTLELTGPRALDHDELAAAFARALGRDVVHVAVPPEAASQAAAAAGADAWTARLVADYARAYAAGFGAEVSDAFARLTGRAPRDVDAFVREVFVPAVTRTRG